MTSGGVTDVCNCIGVTKKRLDLHPDEGQDVSLFETSDRPSLTRGVFKVRSCSASCQTFMESVHFF